MTLKEKILHKIDSIKFKNEYKRVSASPKKFNAFIAESRDYIFLMPPDENAFREALAISAYFKLHKKNVTLVLPEHFVNTITYKEDYTFIVYSSNASNPDLRPDEQLLAACGEKEYDVLFDLTNDERLFYLFLAMKIKAEFKIALFEKENEKIYNLLFNEPVGNNLEKSFRNLLNSIQMF